MFCESIASLLSGEEMTRVIIALHYPAGRHIGQVPESARSFGASQEISRGAGPKREVGGGFRCWRPGLRDLWRPSGNQIVYPAANRLPTSRWGPIQWLLGTSVPHPDRNEF